MTYSEFLRKYYPYLEKLGKQFPTYRFTPNPGEGILGWSEGTRYDAWEGRPKPRSITLATDLSPEEENETRRHEISHHAVDLSPNWSYIVHIQKPTAAYKKHVEGIYPNEQMVEENIIRSGAPKRNKEWIIPGGTTPVQDALVKHFNSFTKYGPQWGSIWGPEYDEEEIKKGKGQNILPRFEFNPNPEDMKLPRIPGATYREDRPLTIKERIELEEKNGYDLWGYIKKYGLPEGYLAGKGEHLTDEFKLPHHITFSTDSVYSTPETPGGVWAQDADRRWHYRPSDYVLSLHPREELREYFEKYEPDSTLDLPLDEEDETVRDIYSPRWRDVVR